MLAETFDIVRQEGTFVTNPFIVHLQHVRGKPFAPSGFVVAQGAEEGFDVSVEMPFEAPVVHSLPGAVRTRDRKSVV